MPEQNWENVSRKVKQKLIAVRDKTGAAFLHQEAPVLRDEIAIQFYRNGGQGVKIRTGNAVRSFDVEYPAPLKAVIINTAPYADFSKEKVIRGKSAKMLAIPIGKALTNAGVARFSGPRDSALPKLTLIARPGKPALLVDTQAKRFDLYFVLVKSVRIPAYTAGMGAFIRAKGQEIRDRFIPVLESALGKAV